MSDCYSRFVPRLLARHLASIDSREQSPFTEVLECAVLFIDISGSSSLMEYLEQSSPEGAETFGEVLDSYFGEVIEEVETCGGDVLKFGGDALLVVWPMDSDRDSTIVAQAALCALRIRDLLERTPGRAGIRIAMRISLICGQLRLAYLGGVNDRWEMMVAGPAQRELELLSPHSQPGTVLVSGTVWAHLRRATNPEGRQIVECPTSGVRCLDALSGGSIEPNAIESEASPGLTMLLRGFIPGILRQEAPATERRWFSQRRHLTVLFLSLPGLEALVASDLPGAQRFVCSLQRIIYHHEGSLVRLGTDDKGLSLLVAFGLPPLAHSDDPIRGVSAALELQEHIVRTGLSCQIGIATGPAIVCEVGSEHRSEFALVGDVIYRAARLCQRGASILCDTPTCVAAQPRIRFELLERIHVKGRSQALEASAPLAIVGPRISPPLSTLEETPDVSLITGQVDRLPLTRQLLLKCASVIGHSFRAETLSAIFPIASEREHVPDMLAELEYTGLLRQHPDLHGDEYAFSQPETRTVLHELMSFSQRRRAHRAALEWYSAQDTSSPQHMLRLLYHRELAREHAFSPIRAISAAASAVMATR